MFNLKIPLKMLKKLPSLLIIGLFGFGLSAQTIVSTTPENQNVILEEFTGIHCVYCPQGHAIAKAIQDAHPDDVSLINIHTGGYANPGSGEPDFRTPYGAAIAGQTGLVGYPAATVNRHNFPGMEQGAAGTTALNRNNWNAAANMSLGQPSNVNVGVEASIDVQTNVLTVHVEAYYTGDSTEATNLLNVALLQNNTAGPQTGGNAGNNYIHMHRLVEMITGTWGEEISTTTAGTFVDRTYTYTIPADYNGVPTELADMEVVAFISQTHQEANMGQSTFPTFTGITLANDANVRYVVEVPQTCARYVNPQVNIQNMGSNPLTSLDIDYTVNGVTETYTWYGNIPSLHSETITMNVIWFDFDTTNTLTVTAPDDENNSNNTATTTFEKAVDATTTVEMELHTDAYGTECRWNVKDYEGNILYSGGPYGNNQTINETFDLPSNCYTFNIIDTYGDGGGPVTLTDSDGTVIYTTNGVYGSGEARQFSTDMFVMGVNQNDLENISLYPNPTSSIIYLKNAENSNIQVYDVLGKLIMTENNISSSEKEINVSSLQTGTYFMKISKDNAVTTKRFIVAN